MNARMFGVALASVALAPTHARAHLPHEFVVALDGGSNFGPSGRAWALVAVDGSLDGMGWWPYETRDWGSSWDPIVRPPTVAGVAGMVVYGSEPVIATDAGELWSFTDGAWLLHPAPAAEVTGIAASDTHVAVVGGVGLYLADGLDGPWTPAVIGSVAGAAFDVADPERIVVRMRDGSMFVGVPPELTPVPAPPEAPQDVAVSEGVVYAGGQGGVWVFRDGAWQACGALPVSNPALDHAERVTRLLVVPRVMHAGTGQFLYTSTDDCASFVEQDVYEEEALYNAGGGTADTPASSFVGLAVGGGVSITGGFRGVAVQPTGLGWHSARVHDSTFVRAIALAGDPDAEADALDLWATSYGGGLLQLVAGGASFVQAGSGTSAESAFGRDVAMRANGGLVYAGDLYGYASADGGASLTRVDVGTDHLVGMRAASGRLWALGARNSSNALSSSIDGFTWEPVPLGEGYPLDVAARNLGGAPVVMARLTTPAGLAYSTDEGQTWTRLYDSAAEVFGMVTWPAGVGERVIRSGADGVWWSADQGKTWTPAAVAPSLPPYRLQLTADGSVMGFDSVGQMWRSPDGGESWEALGEPLSSPQDWLEWRGRVVVATVRGVWWAEAPGEPWRPAPFLDHVDNRHEALTCQDASGEEVRCSEPLEIGGTVRFATRADRFTVTGVGSPRFEVDLDQEVLGSVSFGEPFPLPEEGWHDVRLTVTGGTGTVTLVVGELDGEPIVAPAAPDTGDTGDSGADSADTGGDSGDSGDTGETGASGDSDGERPTPPGTEEPGCGGCASGPHAPWSAGLLALLLLRRGVRTDTGARPPRG